MDGNSRAFPFKDVRFPSIIKVIRQIELLIRMCCSFFAAHVQVTNDVMSLWTGSREGASQQANLVVKEAREVARRVCLISESIVSFDSTSDPVNSSADAFNRQ
jgi:hypothetical protein